MGLTVRYPNGQAVTYNDAHFLSYSDTVWQLYSGSDKRWIASIQASSGAIVEAVNPCKVENPLSNVTGEKALQYVIDHAEELSKAYPVAMKNLKKKLVRYSTRSGKWSG